MTSLYLASGSPRRRELLTQIGVPFETVSAAIDETPLPNESPLAYVERLALDKARAGHQHLSNTPPNGAFCVLGADTAVVLDERLSRPERDKDGTCQPVLMSTNRE